MYYIDRFSNIKWASYSHIEVHLIILFYLGIAGFDLLRIDLIFKDCFIYNVYQSIEFFVVGICFVFGNVSLVCYKGKDGFIKCVRKCIKQETC